MRNSEKNTDTSSSVYEDMTRGRRNTSFSSRISKTVSLDFPPPPMNLFANPLFPPSSARCIRCCSLFSHFSIRCRGCSKPVCCVCAHLDKKCTACRLSYCHPDNIIERSETNYISFDTDFQHECVMSSLQNRVSYFHPLADSHQNNCFLLKTRFCLDLITTEDLGTSPILARTLLNHVLEVFRREPVNINLREAFHKWKPTDKFIKNLVLMDFSDGSQIPVHSDFSCLNPSGRFLFMVKSVSDEHCRTNDMNLGPKNECSGGCRFIKTCIFTVIVGSMFLLCFIFDFRG